VTNNTTPFSRRSAGAVVWRGAFHFFGGFGAAGSIEPTDVSAELWRYDGAWKLLADGGPGAARYVSLCAFDDTLYLFGGCGVTDGTVVFYDHLWRFDGTWREVETGDLQPPRRYAGALVSDGKQLILYGGMAQEPGAKQGRYCGDVWRFEPGQNRWRTVAHDTSGPGARYGFGWAADDTDLYVFGGYDSCRDRSDLWKFEFATDRWRQLSENGPPARYCPALGLVEIGRASCRERV